MVGRTLYSVPWRLIGKRLDARATAAMVEFFLDGELVKTHALKRAGERTDWRDLPEHKTGLLHAHPGLVPGPGGEVGPACAAGSGSCWRSTRCSGCAQAQGVLRLGQRYGDGRLEAACARRSQAGDPSYRTVKGILAAGTEACQPPASAGDGGAAAFLRGAASFANVTPPPGTITSDSVTAAGEVSS